MNYQHHAQSGGARAGTVHCARGAFETPAFMPVGTAASVKALDAADLKSFLSPQIILANTYHLYIRPGEETVQALGGVRGFSGFDGLILTDSGGFQAFSLAQSTKLREDGVIFQSHVDGSRHLFTPRKVIDIQYALDSDIMMVLDDVPALPATTKRLMASLDRTTRWAETSLHYHRQNQKRGEQPHQHLFAILQGGTDPKMREKSARDLLSLEHEGTGFDGFAIGGLSVGEPPEQMYATLDVTTPLLPTDKPRYLMGVGTPEDLIHGIDRGVDMFDCVLPSRNARNGQLFTATGKINIKRSIFARDPEPIDSVCDCYTCRRYSRGYINHLFRAKELSYFRLATLHNLHFYLKLMRQAREAIFEQRWVAFRDDFFARRVQA
jgi:queuine tRNA-ribosyltransferase